MNKEFVPYEQALELKELGFDEKCFAWYHKGWLTFSKMYNLPDVNEHPRNVFAPLYQQAFRWFREKHNIDSWICRFQIEGEIKHKYKWEIQSDDTHAWRIIGNSYEETELACLNKLIELKKIIKLKTNKL